jgi:hypothetical protein
VADRLNNRIEEFSPNGSFITAWGTRGAADGQLILPAGLAIDCHGALLVADRGSNRVEAFAGVAPSVTCAPRRPPPTPPPPVALSVKLGRRTGVLARRSLVVTVRCDRACTVAGRLRLSTPHGGTHTTASVPARRLRAGARATLRLQVSSRGAGLLAKALGKRHRRLVADVTVHATAVVPSGGLPVGPTDYRASVRVTR